MYCMRILPNRVEAVLNRLARDVGIDARIKVREDGCSIVVNGESCDVNVAELYLLLKTRVIRSVDEIRKEVVEAKLTEMLRDALRKIVGDDASRFFYWNHEIYMRMEPRDLSGRKLVKGIDVRIVNEFESVEALYALQRGIPVALVYFETFSRVARDIEHCGYAKISVRSDRRKLFLLPILEGDKLFLLTLFVDDDAKILGMNVMNFLIGFSEIISEFLANKDNDDAVEIAESLSVARICSVRAYGGLDRYIEQALRKLSETHSEIKPILDEFVKCKLMNDHELGELYVSDLYL